MQLWRMRYHAICCLQAEKPRKSGGIIQSKSEGLTKPWTQFMPKAWESGGQMVQILACMQRPKMRHADVQNRVIWMSRSGKEQNSSLLCLSFYSGPQGIGWCPLALMRAIFFTQSTNSYANLFQNPAYRDTPGNAFTSKLTSKTCQIIPKFMLLISQSLPPSTTLLAINFHLSLVAYGVEVMFPVATVSVPFYSTWTKFLP